MKQLRSKLARYNEPQRVKKLGVYPYFRAIESEQDCVVKMNGKDVLMFGSNSYMGLTNHPKVKEAAMAAVKKYGSGCAGSPFLNGTLDIHIELEEALARFLGKERAIIFSTGFLANIGVIPTVVGKGDHIICDESDHASIVEGRRLSFATSYKYKHNNMESLEKVLKRIPFQDTKLIVVDGVFSMEGDIVKLPEIVDLAEKYNASVYVDEAHGLGVLGNMGRGTCDHFHLTDKVDIIMGTFSKSLASIGGFVATDNETINFLKHHSRSYIFTASPSPAATASALAALEIMKTEPERHKHLWEMTRFALNSFRELGFEIGDTSTPIIPLFIRDTDKTFYVTKLLQDDGVFVNPVIPPACSPDATLIRFSLMATHTKTQVQEGIDKINQVFKKLNIIHR